MEEALRALLLTNTDLTNIVATNLAWDVMGQGKGKPGVVMYLIAGLPDYHMAGPSGLVESRVQIDCRAATWTDAKAAARAIEATLSGYSGTIGTIKFGGIFKGGARSEFENTGPDKFYLASADYQIWTGLAA